jgi:signal transduction histidine kinase
VGTELNTHGDVEAAVSDGFNRPREMGMIPAIRLVLAAAALLIIYIDPSQPDRLVKLTYSLLVLYTAYSAMICALTCLGSRILPVKFLHWFDLIWYVALIAVSSGTNSVFFFFFFFAILVASFRWGFSSGLRTAVVSTALFLIVGYISTPAEPAFELNRFLLRAFVLLVLGYMIAHWGGSEVTLKRRLRFLQDITSLSNPRFGIDRTINSTLERLRSFYDADACLLIQPPGGGNYRLAKAGRKGPDISSCSEEITDEMGALLLSPEPGMAVVYRKGASKSLLYEIDTGKTSKQARSYATTIGYALGTTAYLSVPILYRGEASGRLYVAGGSQRMDQSDIEFVLQSIGHVIPLVDNIRLVDHLASDAAEQERQKLARDIHDSVIQPYVGLQLGLAAVREKMARTNSESLPDIVELCELAKEEMNDLRRYLERLKSDEGGQGVLLPAVKRFVAKYSAATGIIVQVKGIDSLHLNDRLAAEAFQMVAEGLSNVRRHTNARHAEIEIDCDQTDLILRIMNDNTNGGARASFQPGSITERAAALGGNARVHTDRDRTVIDVRIPL